MSRIPSGGFGYPLRVEPVLPVQRPRPIGENVVADSEDTRRKAEEARREAEHRRQQVSVHPIQRQLAKDEDSMGSATTTSQPANNTAGAGWGLVVIGVVVIALVIIAICR